ncbi:MAG: hypothetical protein FJ291_23370 [Planctomycetes bacterium]|nr:hypothetical protein [Planctomycetota bacterium]
MDPWQFLLVAEMLRDSELEAGRRSSISRSYYAAYNEIICCLRERHVTVPERDSHEKLCRYLAATGHEVLRAVANDLRGLRDDRLRADYEMEADPTAFSMVQVARAMNQARRIRQQFVSVGAVKAAELIADYLRRTHQMP